MDSTNYLLDANAIPCGLFAAGDDGRLLAVNRDLIELIGSSHEQLVDQHIDKLFAPAGRMLYHSYVFPQLKLHGHIEEIETALLSSTGQRVDILFNARRSVGADGGIIHCVITRLRQRNRLEQQLLNMRLAVQHLPGVLFQLLEDSDGKLSVPFASEAMRTLFGIAPLALQNDAKSLCSAIVPQDREQVLQSLRESSEQVSEWRCKFRTEAGCNMRWLEVHAAPQRRTDNTTLWHGYIADITEHYEHEQALIEKASAERANRSKSEFLARMSHELRTPLNSVLGFAQLLNLVLRDSLDPLHLEYLRNIETSGRDLLFLINEILDISRIEAGQVAFDIDTVAVAPILEKVNRLMTPIALEKQLSIHIECAADLTVRADAKRLQQIVTNLASNALKYNRVNGNVSLSAKRRSDCVRIEVRDDGIGLNDSQLQSLFQPFHRLGAERSSIEGTGLGLTITRALTEQMGGRIDVQSATGKGSCFSVELPAGSGRPNAPQTTPRSQVPISIPAEIRRVLYVEDNPVNVLLMQSLFKLRPSYQLSIAVDAASALDMLREKEPQLLLLDMQLPDASGTELLKKIRSEPIWQSIPAIAVSADAMPEDITHALTNGFNDYWTKPLNIDTALQALDQFLVKTD